MGNTEMRNLRGDGGEGGDGHVARAVALLCLRASPFLARCHTLAGTDSDVTLTGS